MIDMLEYFAAGSPEPAAAPFKTPHALRAHSATYPPAHGSTTAAAATAKKPTAEQIDAAAKTLGDAARAAGLGTFTDATTAPKMPAGADADGAWAGDDDAVFVARPLALQLLGAARGGGALELEARGGFWSRDHSLEGLRARVHAFARARDWLQFHTPRNLCLALVGEVGELCETLQFKPASAATRGLEGLERDARVHFSEELADCTIYLTALCERARVDLAAAARGALAAHPHQSAEPRTPVAAGGARAPPECPRTAALPSPAGGGGDDDGFADHGDDELAAIRDDAGLADARAAAREPPTRFDELRAASARRDAAACAKPPRPRSLCLAVAARAGALAEVFAAQDDAADDGGAAARAAMDDARAAIAPAAGALLAALVRVAVAAHIDLGSACARKLVLNDRKYPADVVRGSSKKYNEYQTATK